MTGCLKGNFKQYALWLDAQKGNAFWQDANLLHSRFTISKLPYLCSTYSYETSKTYGYLISPMKMRSFWEGKTYAKNTTSPLNLCYILERGLDLSILKIWGLLVKGLQSYQLSKLEVTRKSLPTGPGPSRTSRPGFELYRGQIIIIIIIINDLFSLF